MGTSIFVLSPSGHIVYALRADGQTPIATETALLKAKTALFMRASTHGQMNRVMQDPARDTRLRPLQAEFELFWNSGGLPIVVDDVMIGAIGAGGMPASAEWSDEICVYLRDDRGAWSAAASGAVPAVIRAVRLHGICRGRVMRTEVSLT